MFGDQNFIPNTKIQEKIVFFPKILKISRPLSRQNWAAIGCEENVQSIGVTELSCWHDLLFSCKQGIDCSELEKNTIFPDHPCIRMQIIIIPGEKLDYEGPDVIEAVTLTVVQGAVVIKLHLQHFIDMYTTLDLLIRAEKYLVGWLVGRSEIIYNFISHASIGALVNFVFAT